ncbi:MULTISPECIES: YkgJ family cysteine cluster protein [unclassified Methanoregula]|uniref:YkgJ family cysteine cluster protein n=1 Tax=unclassified Methanoregula TaxID=2649730 RepID=UPI0009C90C5F|nr:MULTISPECIES: YkgJ family cysteine cluster protein [unclassified Methanoregula]OPX62020.1 MAG: Flagellin N-methylase [Methanoregula sp. PtaB.Bin085]OPY34305.1 MAG: Flagellin N-methylase [Methanoregula sp. PtaU1.Bin006]
MTFECQQCGDCCSTMGEIIRIRDRIGQWEFRIGFTNGEERIVSIDPDKRDLFRIREETDKKTIACPFLRKQPPEKRICTVHSSRPELCRAYICSRILVLNTNGKKAGRVPDGTRIFVTEDRFLLDLWNTTLRNVQTRDEEEWERIIEDVFKKEGYTVIR